MLCHSKLLCLFSVPLLPLPSPSVAILEIVLPHQQQFLFDILGRPLAEYAIAHHDECLEQGIPIDMRSILVLPQRLLICSAVLHQQQQQHLNCRCQQPEAATW